MNQDNNILNEQLFIESLSELLLEANQNDVVSKIKNSMIKRRVVYFDYAGEKTKNGKSWKVLPGRRYAEIYCFGNLNLSSKMPLCFRAWIRNSSVSRTPRGYNTQGLNQGQYHRDRLKWREGWRMFRVDRVLSMGYSTQSFEGFRPKYNPKDKHLNVIQYIPLNYIKPLDKYKFK